MTTDTPPYHCHCLAVRQAARHITQFYDRFLAPVGLRTTQFSILNRLRWKGPMTINVLAQDMVMDRTTLGRNILPLQRDGLITVAPGAKDRRSKELHLTEAGVERLRQAMSGWAEAQAGFTASYGEARTDMLYDLLKGVAQTELSAVTETAA